MALPDGFDYILGSAGATAGDPTVNGSTLTWTIPSVPFNTAQSLSFKVWSGSSVGPTQAKATVTSNNQSGSATVPFTVTDSFEPNDTAAQGTPVTPDSNVEMSAISSGGDVDYYTIPMPAAGTRIEVHLTNLSADYDLALYAHQSTSIRTGATNGLPLQDGTIADQPLNLQNGGSNSQLTPTALQDVPDPGIPVVQVSANRGTDDEDVGMVSPGGGGTATIAVFGYNGASSPKPYSLRVTTHVPQSPTCPARTFSSSGTPGIVPSIDGLPTNLNTLILVNEKRIGDTYGPGAETTVVNALTSLAGDNLLGVSGAVIPVEGLAQSQYSAWDANPCNVDAANAVANTIANEVAAVKTARPSLKYVVFAGGDDQIPFFRMPDLSLIANETGFADQFNQNEYYGALASGDLLTDNPYLDTRPVPADGRQLFIPDLAGGRLVETPGQIAAAVSGFESSGGVLQKSTGFVSGYDFVTDGSTLVAQRLAANGVSTNTTLLGGTWTKSDLLSAAFPAGGPAAINAWNGHYDNYRALMADGTSLLTTGDLTGQNALKGGIFFTMGCHAGFQTTDAIVGSSASSLDWAQYFAGTGTGFVGNTGFGLGNTDSVAFSEELMADFAGHLDGTLSIGQALDQAKSDYFLSRDAFSSYDEKTLSEAELYGLPMYGVGTAPPAVAAVQPAQAQVTPAAATSPDPVNGATSSTSPSQGSLTPFGSTPASTAVFSVAPNFSGPLTGAGQRGSYYTNGGQVQAPNYRPLQPYVTLPATRAGQTAHGVIIDTLASQDHSPFNPANVTPTVDLAANEPEPQFNDQAWPTKVPTLVSLTDVNGLEQALNLTTGQFFTDTSGSTPKGVERLWTGISGRVTYSSSTDFVPPTIDQIDAFLSNGNVSFTGHFSDLTETGAAGTVAFAQVVYDVDNGGTWNAVQLQFDPSAGTWSGGAPFTGAHVQFFVEVCDTAGNCGYSSNKGRYFDAVPLPAGSGSITLTPSGTQGSGGWFKGPVKVTATSSTGAVVTVSVDGGAFAPPPAGGVPVSGDGSHTINAVGSDGASSTAVVLIDATAPTITITVPPVVRVGSNVPVTYTCLDRGSGATICAGTQNTTAVASGDALNTSSAGPVTVAVTSTDAAGNTGQSQVVVQVVTGPSTPGKPAADTTPNKGSFGLSWAGSAETGATITYSVEHAQDATNGPWTSLATGLTGTSLAVSGEAQGTWYYRVTASDGTFTTTSPVSDAVVVDTTAPTVQLTCPGLVDQGTSAGATYSASDSGGAGLVEPATGTVPVDTSTPGQHTASFTVHDKAGNSGSNSCQYTVNGPPAAPGTPTVSPTPTNGQFTVTWTAATDPNNDTLTYTLLHQNAGGGGYTPVAGGLTSTSTTFSEGEGTWTYEVLASDGRLNGPASAASAPAVADRTAPNAPTLLPTRVAESGTWFKDTVTVSTIENGDPTLVDGSAGSGIDATKTTPDQTFTANGANSVTGSVTDKAGNSKSTTTSFNVDAKAPTLSVTCPARRKSARSRTPRGPPRTASPG